MCACENHGRIVAEKWLMLMILWPSCHRENSGLKGDRKNVNEISQNLLSL